PWCARGNTSFGKEEFEVARLDGGPGVGSRWPSDPEISSDLLETVDDFRVQRDPFLSKLLHAREALLSMHIDSLLSLRLRAVFQLANESVHVPPELVERPERRRIEG